MGIPVLILGKSGSGKSSSMRNLPKESFCVVNVAGKPLPFRGKRNLYSTDQYYTVEVPQSDGTVKRYKGIDYILAHAPMDIIVIDDCQYLMANAYMRRSGEKGFQKFTDIGKDFWQMIDCIKRLPDQKVVYLMAHTETGEDGTEKCKTIGKLLDEKITVEGMFSVVLKAVCTEGRYVFRTRNNGHDTVKSPMGMFEEEEIDNDLALVDAAIRRYWLEEETEDEQTKEL